eukprot:TRINITY_DN70910_c0_g1_i1.p1 TRINITY_DN70910_c0_g1~~TRINITY_DN70910_c0_g1_i1.p1  ORF type:complete len:272 (+),score=20.23 TRINITY_DN70910_c0_g1_i1:82-897(+)
MSEVGPSSGDASFTTSRATGVTIPEASGNTTSNGVDSALQIPKHPTDQGSSHVGSTNVMVPRRPARTGASISKPVAASSQSRTDPSVALAGWASTVVRRLLRVGIRAVCLDFDRTLTRVHSGGAVLPRSIPALAASVSPAAVAFLRALVAADIPVGVVTFSDPGGRAGTVPAGGGVAGDALVRRVLCLATSDAFVESLLPTSLPPAADGIAVSVGLRTEPKGGGTAGALAAGAGEGHPSGDTPESGPLGAASADSLLDMSLCSGGPSSSCL